jgi:hypothetical protein
MCDNIRHLSIEHFLVYQTLKPEQMNELIK